MRRYGPGYLGCYDRAPAVGPIHFALSWAGGYLSYRWSQSGLVEYAFLIVPTTGLFYILGLFLPQFAFSWFFPTVVIGLVLVWKFIYQQMSPTMQ